MSDKAPSRVAVDWLDRFSNALEHGEVAGITELFLPDGYWRDLLAFTWNIRTMEGRSAISAMLTERLEKIDPGKFTLKGEPVEKNDGIVEAWFTFETQIARCEGIVRLRNGLARSILTVTTELKGFEENIRARRPVGVERKAVRDKKSWLELRQEREQKFGYENDQPYCLIIGGSQGGLSLAARLKQLDVPTLVVEKNARPGDTWRKRYRSLVLHDPVWYDHLPYIPFPENWPVFTPKDKMADWLDMYVRAMELDIWTSAECTKATYDEENEIWNVIIARDGVETIVRPKHLIFATGAYGPPRTVDIQGSETFRGEIIHSSQYHDGAAYKEKKCVVLGAASSAHDVCVDLWESGADVTMIQRSPTTVVRSATLLKLSFDNHSENAVARGITTEKADMLAAATPYALLPEVHRNLYSKIREHDQEFYERLSDAGFAIDFGPDETGHSLKAYRSGSGFYIDVGGSDLIIDGEIRVCSDAKIDKLTENHLVLADGRQVEADVIIACTGYHSIQETIGNIVSHELAGKIGPCWGLGSGTKGDPGPWVGELRNMWKPTAHQALWIQGGNLAVSRFYSQLLAIQLKARMEGIETPVY